MKFQLFAIAALACVGFVFANGATSPVHIPHLPRLGQGLVIPNLSLPYSKNDLSSDLKEYSQEEVLKLLTEMAEVYSGYSMKTTYAAIMITKAFFTDLYQIVENIATYDISKLPEEVQTKVKNCIEEITALVPVFVNSVITIITELPKTRSVIGFFSLFTQEFLNCTHAVFSFCYNLYELGIPVKNFLPNTTAAIIDFVSACYSDLVTLIQNPFYITSMFTSYFTGFIANPFSAFPFFC